MKIFGTIGAFCCFLAVLAGALGSHALKAYLSNMGGLSNFDLATRYMFYHGLALILLGFVKDRYANIPFQLSGWLMVAGTILFQGNLYLISLTGVRLFGFLTPVGGLCLMAGWLLFAYYALQVKTS
ncbi:MAG: DUF423 domain-containing protein [Desulfobacterales bacterium]|nr:MAG: DUF423 domain-containing protein [Desulfobacterales bacterium]